MLNRIMNRLTRSGTAQARRGTSSRATTGRGRGTSAGRRGGRGRQSTSAQSILGRLLRR